MRLYMGSLANIAPTVKRDTSYVVYRAAAKSAQFATLDRREYFVAVPLSIPWINHQDYVLNVLSRTCEVGWLEREFCPTPEHRREALQRYKQATSTGTGSIK